MSPYSIQVTKKNLIKHEIKASKTKTFAPASQEILGKNKNAPLQVKVISPNIFKRAQRGLYGGECIRFGDKISSYGNRSKRRWLPNVQRIPLWSETLQQRLQIKVTPSALRYIEMAGGLDNYILGQREAESNFAAALKRRILIQSLIAESHGVKEIHTILQNPFSHQGERVRPTVNSLDSEVSILINQLGNKNNSSKSPTNTNLFCPG